MSLLGGMSLPFFFTYYIKTFIKGINQRSKNDYEAIIIHIYCYDVVIIGFLHMWRTEVQECQNGHLCIR